MSKVFLPLLCSSSLKIELTFWRMGNPVSRVTHTKENLENVEAERDHNEAREVSITEFLGWILAQKSCIVVNILAKCKSGVRFVELRQKGCLLRNVLLSNNGHEPQNTNCISIVKEKKWSKNWWKLGKESKNQNGNLRWHLPLGVRPPPPLNGKISRHFFTPLFFFCNWILHTGWFF